jgi:hypothetical protein
MAELLSVLGGPHWQAAVAPAAPCIGSHEVDGQEDQPEDHQEYRQPTQGHLAVRFLRFTYAKAMSDPPPVE